MPALFSKQEEKGFPLGTRGWRELWTSDGLWSTRCGELDTVSFQTVPHSSHACKHFSQQVAALGWAMLGPPYLIEQSNVEGEAKAVLE